MAVNEPTVPEETLRLREYLGVLARRKWSIIAITLLAVVGALFYARQQTPIYEATAEVQATVPLQLGSGGTSTPNMDTESKLVLSEPVTKCASLIMADPLFKADPSAPLTMDLATACDPKNLALVTPPKGLTSHVSVTFPQQATVLDISYSDPDRAIAWGGAQAFALAYVQIKTQSAQAQLDALRKPYDDKLTAKGGLEDQLASVNKQIADQQALIASATDPSTVPAATAKLNDLEQQRSVIQQQITQISTTLLGLDPSKVNPPQLVLPAAQPQKPVSPNKILDGVLGLFIGLAFGVGLAILRERLDDSLRGRTDLERAAGVPVLAVIPKVPGWKKRQDPKLVSVEQPKSAVSEAYRTLRTSVLFSSVQRGVKAIMVVSPTAGEGKTTTAANLAVSLADANKRVILVSADLRKPRLHRFFGLENEIGLSNVLSGEVKPWEALQDPRIDNLRIMASGPVPARPGELLQSEAMGELIVELGEVADFVIVDTAPILLVADALSLTPLVEGVLFVADSEVTTRGAVSHAREQLEQVGAPILGAVFNNFDPSKARSYYPYYGYYPYRYRYGRYGYGERYGAGYYGGTQSNGGGRGDRDAARLLEETPQDRP